MGRGGVRVCVELCLLGRLGGNLIVSFDQLGHQILTHITNFCAVVILFP